jgi:hypothetical protein
MVSPAFLLTALGVAAMLLAMLIGPWLSHPDYSSLRHSTSELAGSGMPGAWLMRGGFIAFGGGVAAAALLAERGFWPVRAALVIFGCGMIGAAIWPHNPIDPALGNDAVNDARHTIAASTVGMAFMLAVGLHLAHRGWPRRDGLGWLALAASALLPLAMLLQPGLAGLWQRLMFGISFVWLLRHASGCRAGAAQWRRRLTQAAPPRLQGPSPSETERLSEAVDDGHAAGGVGVLAPQRRV